MRTLRARDRFGEAGALRGIGHALCAASGGGELDCAPASDSCGCGEAQRSSSRLVACLARALLEWPEKSGRSERVSDSASGANVAVGGPATNVSEKRRALCSASADADGRICACRR